MSVQLAVTLTGKDFSELKKSAMQFLEMENIAPTKTTPTAPKKKAAPAPVEETEEFESEETEDANDIANFDDADEEPTEDEAEVEDEETEAPASKKKSAPAFATKKAAKITDDQLNKAGIAHAKRHTRPKTLALLKKHFGVKSLLEIKDADRAKALKLLGE